MMLKILINVIIISLLLFQNTIFSSEGFGYKFKAETGAGFESNLLKGPDVFLLNNLNPPVEIDPTINGSFLNLGMYFLPHYSFNSIFKILLNYNGDFKRNFVDNGINEFSNKLGTEANINIKDTQEANIGAKVKLASRIDPESHIYKKMESYDNPEFFINYQLKVTKNIKNSLTYFYTIKDFAKRKTDSLNVESEESGYDYKEHRLNLDNRISFLKNKHYVYIDFDFRNRSYVSYLNTHANPDISGNFPTRSYGYYTFEVKYKFKANFFIAEIANQLKWRTDPVAGYYDYFEYKINPELILFPIKNTEIKFDYYWKSFKYKERTAIAPGPNPKLKIASQGFGLDIEQKINTQIYVIAKYKVNSRNSNTGYNYLTTDRDYLNQYIWAGLEYILK